MGSSISSLDFLDPPSREGELGMLGHYRVIDQLGKGGMGFVFRAEDTRLQRTVALKVMNRKIAATPNSRARFISEARAMAAVHHDNVATIFEVGELNKTPYMAMEMLKGSTLEKFKGAPERPSYDKIIQFAKETARGLAAAHAQGIVHRDIKPANMWIEAETDRIKILDFGLALASTPVDQLAGRGAVIGTPGYLSPEQARSEPLDDRSDLYSVGVVLYELATGHLPLHNKSVAGQLIAILSKPPRPLRELNPDIPQPLADLIHKLLRKEPRDRVRSAALMETELDRVAVECESKSEVAQALNKLQMGLNEIVSQKSEPDFGEALPIPDMPDPFAALPEGLPGAPIATAPVATSASKSGTHATAASPYQKKRQATPTQKEPEPSALKKYWPIGAAVAAITLVGVPLYVFMTASGTHSQNVIVDSNPINNSVTSPSIASKPKPNPTRSQPPKNNSQNNNRNKNNSPVVPVDSTAITEAMVPGAIELIGAHKGNGSFENLNSGGQAITGSGQAKKSIPGWSATFKGNKAGLSAQDARGSSDGQHYAFINKKSSLDLNSNTVEYETRPGDIFRLTFDVGSVPGEGKWLGKTRYTAILGFRGKDGAASRWKLGEVQDQTNVDKKKQTIGYEYIVQADDVGRKPFVKITMSEGNDRRAISYLDNVRLSVQSPSNSMAANIATPSNLPTATNPSVNMTPDNKPESEPPPASVMATNAMPNDTPPTNTDPEPTPSYSAPLEKVTIRTSDGRGADSSVKNGGSSRDTLGTKSFVSIQTRGDKPIQHSYLKFDLEKITPGKQNKNNKKDIQRKTGRVALMLKTSGKKSPAGGKITVYGAANKEVQAWTESGSKAIHWKVSYSEAGLNALPLLAELSIPDDQTLDSYINITSPELADFIRNTPGSLTTLILAGRSSDNLPLNFVSREGDKNNAPALIVEVAE